MVQDIVFHLGDCKTGTTSIQSVLASGGVKSEAEILYTARFNHLPLARSLMHGKKGKRAQFSNLRKALSSSSASHAVVSAEDFEFVDPQDLHKALHQFMPAEISKIRFIAYVRPHADRLVSTFSERSKKGGVRKPLAAFHKQILNSEFLMYAPRFQKWRDVFGDQFTLRPFVRDQMVEGDVVKDFFSFVLRSADFQLLSPSQHNESLSVSDVAMMRHMHRVLQEQGVDLRDQHKALGWYLADYLAALPQPVHQAGSERPRLHKMLAEKVMQAYREDAAALDAAFFDGTPMSDALEAAPSKAVEQAQSFDPEDHFSEAELRRLTAIAQMFGHVMASDPRHFLWAVRPDAQRSDTPPKARGQRALKWLKSQSTD